MHEKSLHAEPVGVSKDQSARPLNYYISPTYLFYDSLCCKTVDPSPSSAIRSPHPAQVGRLTFSASDKEARGRIGLSAFSAHALGVVTADYVKCRHRWWEEKFGAS